MLSTSAIRENPITLLIFVLALIVVIVGGVIAIVNPDTLTFPAYLNALQNFGKGLGLFAIGKGILQHGNSLVAARNLDSLQGDPDDTASHG